VLRLPHANILPRSLDAELPPVWLARLQRLDHAFQPIVNVHTGLCYGYEALLRGSEQAGFESIQAVFDTAHAEGVLPAVERALWSRAIEKFTRLPHHRNVKLFCNADNRGVLTQAEERSRLVQSLDSFGLSAAALCLEISERHSLNSEAPVSGTLDELSRDGFRLAIDDFGRGFSGLELLYSCPSDFVKIDRFFIAGIERDRQKRVLAETMVKLAHLLGRFVVAEGVETEAEFAVCRELGCDLVQGYLIQRPAINTAEMLERYDVVESIVSRERRRREAAADEIAAHLIAAPTVAADAPLSEALATFGRNPSRTFIIVLDAHQRPLGLVREQDVKGYLYNPYGRDLLSNASYRKSVLAVLSRSPIVDIHAPIERLVESYVRDQGDEGVIVLRDMKYAGFLDSKTLLNIISERNLAAARDQNPLTRLPGNRRIYEFVSRALSDLDVPYVLAYFDFDHFKPFNDRFGFRQGDRALILFSELLGKNLIGENHFVGHIGGDDFFAGVRDIPFEQFQGRVRLLLDKFRADIESFYDPGSRAAGGIVGTDRDGNTRTFPFMRVSAVILDLQPGRNATSLDDISALIAEGKRAAKRSATGVQIVRVAADGGNEEALGETQLLVRAG
jgi:EAL domain-containing protein (putative c-di-GMP-specific phosphodiesterase class I)/GGDEF domain-containing protein/CBS domain-containing protein